MKTSVAGSAAVFCAGLFTCFLLGACGQQATVASATSTDAGTTENASVTGEVVDLWCFIDHEGRGEKHKSCAVTCVGAGNPLGLAADDGQIYVIMGSEKHQPGTDVLLEKMAQKVTVTGTLVRGGGVTALYVESVKDA